MAANSSKGTVEIKRVGKFGIVGIINTLLDFGIFNALTKFAHFGLIQANIVSTTCAMLFSFFANKKVVFKQEGGSVVRQAILFFAITAFGLYVIQNGIIYLLTDLWIGPINLFVNIIRSVGINFFSDGFYINNGAKAIATLASLTWNYIMYKKVVFK
jgi:putative flippase GtrA